MKKSIKRQIAITFIGVVIAIMLISTLINGQFLGRYYIKELIKKAKVITIASRPFFIDQEYAIKVLKELFNYDII